MLKKRSENMFNISIRLILIYCFTLLCARLMGKRQMGELELPELVSAFFLSETATYYVTDPDAPLSYGVIPIITISLLEVIISSLSIKIPIIKRMTDSSPTLLIRNGKIDQKALSKSRISVTELYSQLRQKGFTDHGQIAYAILEADGKISILPSDAYSPLTKKDASLKTEKTPISHLVAVNGKINRSTLKSLGISEKSIKETMKKQGLKSVEDYFIISYDENGSLKGVKKEK
ncbi:MAG: DUF421 domain-containing protein [Ruminococcaceae bacterium]|nr:DUF421 domain-containing protein [Oscillospiraceae bacterium]